MKPILGKAIRVAQITLLFFGTATLGILMGEQSFTQKQVLETKKSSLVRENENLAEEIKSLERRVTLLRSDAKTIEKAAKRKLGMSAPGETIYIFEGIGLKKEETTLGKADN